MKFKHFLILLFLSAFVSCIPQKRTIYMQDKSESEKYKNPYKAALAITEAYKIQAKDYLYIRVMTPDEKVASLYNLGGGQSSMSQMGQGGSSKFMSYLVNDEGNIDFPYVGDVQVKGLSLKEVKEKMKDVLSKRIATFSLQVQLTNAQFTVLGEVGAPGQYSMTKDQLTLYEAISLAGDLTVYGKRKKVKVVRPGNKGTRTFTLDLTDKNLIDSQRYYIYPNDIVYVEPIKAKMFGFGETFSLGMVSSVLSLVLVFVALK